MIAFTCFEMFQPCHRVNFQSLSNRNNVLVTSSMKIVLLAALKKTVSICRLDVIDKCFSRRTVEEIISALVIFSSIYRKILLACIPE